MAIYWITRPSWRGSKSASTADANPLDPEAVDDLERIAEYIAENNPDSALRVARRAYVSVESLAEFPARGRIGWVEGTRELVLAPLPYVVVYRINEAGVEILHVHHGAQNWRK